MWCVERPLPTPLSPFGPVPEAKAAIDQLRTVDKQRLVKRIGSVRGKSGERILGALVEMFTL